MIRRDQGQPRSRQLYTEDLEPSRVVDVIEMQNRKQARVGAPPLQMVAEVDAVQPFTEERRRETAHPLVEVAEHELRTAHVPIGDDRGEALRLVPPLEDRGTEMHVVEVQR